MTTLEFKVHDKDGEIQIDYRTDGMPFNAGIHFVKDEIELDEYILPLKKKYDQVIQVLPNGEKRII